MNISTFTSILTLYNVTTRDTVIGGSKTARPSAPLGPRSSVTMNSTCLNHNKLVHDTVIQ